MKKIGFVDYYISEWHANNYPIWIADINKAMGEDFTVAYAWAELDISPVDGLSTDEWCSKYNVSKCNSIQQLCQQSDYIVILAPSDPDKHLEYAGSVLPYGKPTYIDKTFAPDCETAVKIFDIARLHGASFFSTSALRYAKEIEELSCDKIKTTGGGSNMAEYIIHQAEMVVKVLNAAPISAVVNETEDGYNALVSFEGGKTAEITYAPALPFSVSIDEGSVIKICSDFFRGLIADMLRFFTSGKPSFDTGETIRVMKLRDLILSKVDTLSRQSQ